MKFALFVLSLLLVHQIQAQSSAKLRLGNPGGKKGALYLAVYNTKETWMLPEKAFSKSIIPIAAKDTTLDIGSMPDGQYALAMFLDENGNGRLDKNFLGIPSEKYGFSGTRQPLFRAPHFDEAVIRLTSEQRTVSISLR